ARVGPQLQLAGRSAAGARCHRLLEQPTREEVAHALGDGAPGQPGALHDLGSRLRPAPPDEVEGGAHRLEGVARWLPRLTRSVRAVHMGACAAGTAAVDGPLRSLHAGILACGARLTAGPPAAPDGGWHHRRVTTDQPPERSRAASSERDAAVRDHL